jgi:AraC-like DNA-binding protein
MRSDPLMDYFAQRLIAFIKDMQGDAAAAAETRVPDGPKALQIIRLFEMARDLTGDDLLGLADTPCPRGTYLFRGELAVRCSTLGEALDLIFRYQRLVCPALRCSLTVEGGEAVTDIIIDGPQTAFSDVQTQWMLITTHRFSQWLIGSEIALNWVDLTGAMEVNFGDYARIFGGQCSFNRPSNRFSIPSHYLKRRILHSAADYSRQVSSPIGNIEEPVTVSRTWKQMVKRALRSNLDEAQPLSTIEDLADELGVSSQTLRRRLKAEDSSYRALKAEVRREAALDTLSAEGASLSDASFKAGFAESNGLTRALRQSTGLGSSYLRDQIRAWQPDESHAGMEHTAMPGTSSSRVDR